MVGNLLALGTSVVGALFNLVYMPLMKRYSALRISAWTILFGSLFMLPFTQGSWGKVDWSGLGASHYVTLFYNVLICTVLAFVVWNVSMFKIGAARSNFFRYVVPATAVVAGVLFFDESVAIGQIVGGVFMAAGLVWISTEKKPPVLVENKGGTVPEM